MRGNFTNKRSGLPKEWEEADDAGQRQKRMKATNIRASRWPAIANGAFMGHAFKKRIVRSKSSSGFRAPFVPG